MKYMDPKDLHYNLNDPSLLILDVRDYDFDHKVIKNAVNIPFEFFTLSHKQAIVSKMEPLLRTKTKLVVHCALSQVRGPKTARILTELLSSSIDICILRGGYDDYSVSYPDDIVEYSE